jgi:zinc protease
VNPSFPIVAIAGALLLASCPSPGVDADGVLRATLANGLQVVIVRNTLAPVVSTDLAYLVGSRDDPPDIPGLAHAQEHMLFRGTKALSTDALATIATALGGNYSAQTGDTVTEYTFTVPASDLDAVLRIEADRMRGINDADSQWRIERGVIDEEVNASASVEGNDFLDDVHALAYRGTSLERPGVGTVAAFDRLNGRRLKEFYDRWYAPNNAVFVITGDVDPQATLTAVRKRFADIPAHSVPQHDALKLTPFLRRRIVRRAAVSSPTVILAFRFPGISSPDAYASAVLQEMLTADDGPIIAFATRADVQDAGWVDEDANDDAQLAFAKVKLSSASDPETTAPDIEAAVAAYVARGVPQQPFERAKYRVMRDQDDRTKIDDQASSWVQTVAVDHEASKRREIERLARVTRDDVNRVARRYMAAANIVVGVLTPRSGDALTAADLLKPNAPSERLLTGALTRRGIPDWGIRAIDAPPPVAPLAADRFRLLNGMTFIVRTIPGAHAIHVAGDIHVDRLPFRDPNWRAWFDMTVMFSQASLWAQIPGDESTGSAGPNTIDTTPGDFEKAMTVLARNERYPAFTPSTLTGATQKYWPANSGHAPSLPEIRSAFARAVRPERSTVVIAGDITTERARRIVQRLFESWHAQGPAAPARVGENPLPSRSMKLRGAGTVDDVLFAQNVALRASDPQTYALTLGDTILGGGSGNGDQNRIARRAQQFAGLVYGIRSSYESAGASGRLTIVFDCAPRNEARVTAMIDDEVKRMRNTRVSDFELRIAKAEEIRNLTLMNSSLENTAGALLAAARDGRAPDQPRIDAEHLRSVDAASIQRVFAKYIQPKGFTRLVIGP